MDGAGSSVSLTIAAQHIFDGARMCGPGSVRISEGRIESITLGEATSRDSVQLPADAIQLPADAILAPGFVDIQVNGGGGVLLNDEPTEACVRRMVEAHRRTGTTGSLPTLITDRTDVIERLAAIAPAASQIPGVLGFHLEGPALNKARKGIHLGSEIRVPNARDLAAMKRFGDCGRSIVTLAPECVPPSLIDDLLEAGLRISIGHSEATAMQVRQAADCGAT